MSVYIRQFQRPNLHFEPFRHKIRFPNIQVRVHINTRARLPSNVRNPVRPLLIAAVTATPTPIAIPPATDICAPLVLFDAALVLVRGRASDSWVRCY